MVAECLDRSVFDYSLIIEHEVHSIPKWCDEACPTYSRFDEIKGCSIISFRSSFASCCDNIRHFDAAVHGGRCFDIKRLVSPEEEGIQRAKYKC